jgi:hypothetical protein
VGKSHKMLRLEGDPPVTKWEVFKTLIKSQFYPIGYKEDYGSIGITYMEEARKECARVHHEFKKMAIMLGISPKNLDVLLKYLGGLHSHLWRKVMLFKPRIVDEAYVQA